MNLNDKSKPYDCWSCKYVNKCEHIDWHTCDKFEFFTNWTVKSICKKLHMNSTTFHRYMKEPNWQHLFASKYNVIIDKIKVGNKKHIYHLVEL